MPRSSLRRSAAVLCLPAVLIPTMAHRAHLESTRVSGTFTMTYSQQQTVPLSDAPGHMLALFESRGSNSNKSPYSYMDGAEVTNAETVDLTQGNGVNQGYIIFARGADTTYNKWNGKVTTTLGDDKKPVTTFSGTWTKTGGAGQYASVTGSGSFKGRMTSENGYVGLVGQHQRPQPDEQVRRRCLRSLQPSRRLKPTRLLGADSMKPSRGCARAEGPSPV